MVRAACAGGLPSEDAGAEASPARPDRSLLGLLRQPRLLIGAALAGFVGLSWLYLAGEMAAMDPDMTMSPLEASDLALYQLTPLKQVCLSHCRSPFDFLVNHWRDGAGGAWRMGWSHGLYCLGCCWILMALLFVVGAMDLLWVAGFAALVLLEKLLPSGLWIARVSGVALIAWGVWVLSVGQTTP